jgi:hypothetical protein
MTPSDTMTIDLLSSKSFADGHPVDQYHWLHENAPVYRHDEPDGGAGFWAVTGAAEVNEASKNPQTFSSAAGGIMINDFPPEELEFFRTMILAMDPPKHSFYRKLVGGLFTPKRAALWTDSIGDTVRSILDEACELGECILVEDLAGKLPSYVIAELVGIPRPDGVKLYRWTEIIHSAPDVVSDEQRSAAMGDIIGYGASVRQDKLANPGDDLATRLVQAEIDGRHLTEQEFASFFMLLINAGGTVPLAVVDWQTILYGPGPCDVAYFLGAAMEPEERRRHELDLVRLYHGALLAHGVTDYDWDRCWRDYRLYSYSGLLNTIGPAMVLRQTERGDQMLTTLARRHATHALDMNAAELLAT